MLRILSNRSVGFRFGVSCELIDVSVPRTGRDLCAIAGGGGGLSKVISTLIGVISIATPIISLVTNFHDPLSWDCLFPKTRNLRS